MVVALTYAWPGVTGLATTTHGRRNLAGLIAKDTSGNARAGIFPAHANALVSARGDMNVDIAAFTGVAVQFGGPILIANDGTSQLPSVLVSPGSGTNYYVIYAKQNESTSPGTDASTTVVFGAQLSTTSLAVARAALPTGALELGTVQMPTGKTATNNSGVVISATHQFTAGAGGVVWVRDSTELAAWSPADGSHAYRIDTAQSLRRVGGVWAPERILITEGGRALGASTYVLTTSYTDIPSATVTATVPAGPVRVTAIAMLWNGESGDHRTAELQIMCDGVKVGDSLTGIGLANILTSGGVDSTVIINHSPGAGSHTWKVQGKASNNSSVVAKRVVLIVEKV
jgi:hypothetical protein